MSSARSDPRKALARGAGSSSCALIRGSEYDEFYLVTDARERKAADEGKLRLCRYPAFPLPQTRKAHIRPKSRPIHCRTMRKGRRVIRLGAEYICCVPRKWRGPDLIGINSPAATGACIVKGLPCILTEKG